jgi:hypothetical protein
MNRTILFVSTFSLTIAATNADAVIVSYSNRPLLNAAAGALTTQNFNSFPPGTNVFLGVPYDFGDFSALNDANPAGGGDIINPGTVNGSTEIVGTSTLAGAKFTLMFDFPITALGFDALNLADQRNDNLIFNNATADVVAILDPVDQTRFWGFISNTPFTTFTIQQIGFIAGGGPTDGYRIDDVTYSTAAVPEVSSFLLVGLFGLAMLGIVKLRAFVRGTSTRIAGSAH